MKKNIVLSIKYGFTLIELMVVVAIIGVLMAAGIVAFTSVQRNARDARRVSDVRSIQKAFDSHAALNGTFSTVQSMVEEGFVTGNLPNPPHSGESYSVSFNPSSQVYCICSPIEGKNRGNALTAGSSGSCSFTSDSGSATHFCVTNDASFSTFTSTPPSPSSSSQPTSSPEPSPSPSPSPLSGCTAPWGVAMSPSTYEVAPTCGGTYVYANYPEGTSCPINRRHRALCTPESVMNSGACVLTPLCP